MRAVHGEGDKEETAVLVYNVLGSVELLKMRRAQCGALWLSGNYTSGAGFRLIPRLMALIWPS